MADVSRRSMSYTNATGAKMPDAVGTQDQAESSTTDLPQGLAFPPKDDKGEPTLGPCPGKLATLPSGSTLRQKQVAQTHYKLTPARQGDDDVAAVKEVKRGVVYVNGIFDLSLRTDMMAAEVTAAGHAFLQYDHYGRGWSGTPHKAKFNLDQHVRQLHELLEATGLTDGAGTGKSKVVLVGHSMGGCVAVHFARQHPEVVAGVILMAPAGVMQPPVPGFACVQSCMPCVIRGMLKGQKEAPPGDFYDLDKPGMAAINEWSEQWGAANKAKNGLQALACSAAAMPVASSHAAVRALGKGACAKHPFPVLLLRPEQGKDPMVVLRPRDVTVYAKALGDRFKDSVVKDAGHCFFLEKAAETHAEILAFLGSPQLL